MDDNWVKDVKYYLMPCRNPVKGYETQYQAAYECWKAAWIKFRTEIGVKEHLHSDGFFLPHEMGALFYKDECIGLSAFTYGSLAQGPMPDLSWFNGWTDISYQRLKNISTNAMIGSQFTVNPKFTGKGHIVRWKEIIFLYTFMRFESSIADVMAGHLNLTRKVDEACGESFGATVLDPCKVFNYYGVDIPAQLVAYQKENIQTMKDKQNVHELCNKLWAQLVHLSEYPVEKANSNPNKKAA